MRNERKSVYMGRTEAAMYLGQSPATITKWANEGILTGAIIRGRWLFKRDELDKIYERGVSSAKVENAMLKTQNR